MQKVKPIHSSAPSREWCVHSAQQQNVSRSTMSRAKA